ncbi:hypothetical protein SERLA73DRAFT_69182 [Serpula lacrymans var. lacrymans S7.3]|uniref:Uncharacterized protein n=2 Tax=Serpula lacrymans var. lacrymans TaxID=341189 RepID=F8PK43_SERL3|nr:uncharacterized protein SERLADRAFT_433075 [Serpula lacrymans var. lacrymans S7.9]EGO03283.1 hypothetical protein SERLA73DRAFT_69182 [Serpula lacrymans var. lacrymans S7.3]EGO29061.1 hypothetical protein SERLADRAFT_433075 [Serpula lacrymans var. lacrymans S7.9]
MPKVPNGKAKAILITIPRGTVPVWHTNVQNWGIYSVTPGSVAWAAVISVAVAENPGPSVAQSGPAVAPGLVDAEVEVSEVSLSANVRGKRGRKVTGTSGYQCATTRSQK